MPANKALAQLVKVAKEILEVDALTDGSVLAGNLRVALHNCEQDIRDCTCVNARRIDAAQHALMIQVAQMSEAQSLFLDAYTHMCAECLMTKKRVEQLMGVITGDEGD